MTLGVLFLLALLSFKKRAPARAGIVDANLRAPGRDATPDRSC
jgi:hypothetical protein